MLCCNHQVKEESKQCVLMLDVSFGVPSVQAGVWQPPCTMSGLWGTNMLRMALLHLDVMCEAYKEELNFSQT